jgi:hypothetical protein
MRHAKGVCLVKAPGLDLNTIFSYLQIYVLREVSLWIQVRDPANILSTLELFSAMPELVWSWHQVVSVQYSICYREPVALECNCGI